MTIRLPLEERFWSKVDRRGGGECWPWLRTTTKFGYGNFKLCAGELDVAEDCWPGAHRIAFRLVHGRWPEPQGLHGCDNPPCCNAENPEHIHEGTQATNLREVRDRGRHPRYRLTWERAAAIRLVRVGGASYAALVEEFGVSEGAVSHVLNGRSWVR